MGGLCSRSSKHDHGHNNKYAKTKTGSTATVKKNNSSNLTKLQVQDSKQEVQQPIVVHYEIDGTGTGGAAATEDDFYDGIPRYNAASLKSRSIRSKQAAVAKVSEVSSRLGRAGTLGLGKAAEVLDTLGSSMTNLNSGSGFVSVVATKGNEIGILSFEVANTIMKGHNLMKSLSKRSIRQLKEVVLPSDGVQNLVSEDMDELLQIVAADKREELKVFSGEVVRFGNRCKDAQWHELDRYFEKISRKLTPQKQLRDEADSVMQQLMTLVQSTAELYHEMHGLDRFEQDYQRKRQEEDKSLANHRGDSVAIIRGEMKSQRKQVKVLKKKSLWSRSMEEVMEKLVDIVQFLHFEIHNAFGSSEGCEPADESPSSHRRLGPSGLSLHYANIVIQIDTLVSCLFHIRIFFGEELEMATNEALRASTVGLSMENYLAGKAPPKVFFFSWVAACRKILMVDNLRNRWKIIENWSYIPKKNGIRGLLQGLNCLSIGLAFVFENFIPVDDTEGGVPSSFLIFQDSSSPSSLSTDRRLTPGISKSQDFNHGKTELKKQSRLSKSCNTSPTRGSKELLPLKRISSGLPLIVLGVEKEQALDVIDALDVINRVDVLR
ncbi:protein PSK SIMULATOR 1 [Quercus suber]